MIRNLKTLFFAFAAFLAVTSTASAQGAVFFTGEAGIQTVKGFDQEGTILSITNGEHQVSCEEVAYQTEATVSGTETEIELSPTFTNCETGAWAGTLSPNGCTYRIHDFTKIEETSKGAFQITCPLGKVIDFHQTLFGTLKCTITFPAQTPGGSVTMTNVEGPSESTDYVKLVLNVSGLTFQEHEGTGFGRCTNNTELPNSGSYTGAVALKGWTHAGVHKGISID